MKLNIIFFSFLFVLSIGHISDLKAEQTLSDYNTLDNVSRIFDDSSVVSELKSVLGSDYNLFSDNFDVFGQPHQTKEGGIFVEGWLKDLYLEQASAFVIQPNGKVYAAWVDPTSHKIHYRSNDKEIGDLQRDIKLWSERFIDYQLPSVVNTEVLSDSKVQNAGYIRTELVAADFSVTLKHRSFSLGDLWDEQAKKWAGAPIDERFVGEVSSGDNSYKYYQHNYTGFEIYTANLFWDKAHRDIDSYIIAQITLNTPGIVTSRGVSVGSAQSELVKKYGQGMVDDSDNQYWLYYDGDGKRISFQIENNIVSHIMMGFNIDN